MKNDKKKKKTWARQIVYSPRPLNPSREDVFNYKVLSLQAYSPTKNTHNSQMTRVRLF